MSNADSAQVDPITEAPETNDEDFGEFAVAAASSKTTPKSGKLAAITADDIETVESVRQEGSLQRRRFQ